MGPSTLVGWWEKYAWLTADQMASDLIINVANLRNYKTRTCLSTLYKGRKFAQSFEGAIVLLSWCNSNASVSKIWSQNDHIGEDMLLLTRNCISKVKWFSILHKFRNNLFVRTEINMIAAKTMRTFQMNIGVIRALNRSVYTSAPVKSRIARLHIVWPMNIRKTQMRRPQNTWGIRKIDIRRWVVVTMCPLQQSNSARAQTRRF